MPRWLPSRPIDAPVPRSVSTPASANDHASLLALRQGEAVELNRLIGRWQRPLHSFAYRYVQNSADAHDLVAETFVRLYQQRERLRPDTKLSAWLFTTLTNLCHNHHRWQRRHPTVALAAVGDGRPDPGDRWTRAEAEPASELPTPVTVVETDETAAAVRAAIDRLPHDLKVTLLLHHYDRFSYQEISEITHCSVRGVETRLYRARRLLRDRLAPLMNEVPRP
jgi:RNA polymerase sigma-70 factor, ECF subfamily